MKKYFLDKEYQKFTTRIVFVLSIIAGITTSAISDIPDDDFLFWLLGLGGALSVWVLYFVVRWILKALPTDID